MDKSREATRDDTGAADAWFVALTPLESIETAVAELRRANPTAN